MTHFQEKGFETDIVMADIDKSVEEGNQNEEPNNSVELIRKCSQYVHDTSWDQSHYVSANLSSTDFKDMTNNSQEYLSPPHIIDASRQDSRTDNSKIESILTLDLEKSWSISKDNNLEDSSSNDNDTERSSASKRYRRNSVDEITEMRPRKKTKCTDSCTSINSDTRDSKAQESSSILCSDSEISFKSIKSNYSFKILKGRRKSDSILIRDVLQRSKRFSCNTSNFSKSISPGTPRKDKSLRRSNRTKVWKIMDICTWIGKKGYQSITGLYSDALQKSTGDKQIKNDVLPQEVKRLQVLVEELDQKYNGITNSLVRENEALKDEMKKMASKITELETKISIQQTAQRQAPCAPLPPPPPPPPPPPLPPSPRQPSERKLARAHTIARCGSAPPGMAGPRLTITPEDIANVKLRKAKDNPVRPKPISRDTPQPLVTQDMLEATRAKLMRKRPVAASTPKEQLTELEKCLLQESSVTSMFRRRVTRGAFRSASGEELRVRPYPVTRCAHSPRSPRSPRSRNISRTPASPLKFPIFCANTP